MVLRSCGRVNVTGHDNRQISYVELAEDDEEIKQSHHVHTVSGNDVMVSLVSRFSNWCHLQLTIAWLLRYKSYLRAQVKTASRTFDRGPLKVSEIQSSMKEMSKLVI